MRGYINPLIPKSREPVKCPQDTALPKSSGEMDAMDGADDDNSTVIRRPSITTLEDAEESSSGHVKSISTF